MRYDQHGNAANFRDMRLGNSNVWSAYRRIYLYIYTYRICESVNKCARIWFYFIHILPTWNITAFSLLRADRPCRSHPPLGSFYLSRALATYFSSSSSTSLHFLLLSNYILWNYDPWLRLDYLDILCTRSSYVDKWRRRDNFLG